MSQIETSYHGNPNLKPVGYAHKFEPDQISEYLKCKGDIIYFIESYCKIVTLDRGLQPFILYECQKEKVAFIMGERKAILMEGRQQGKTITAAACILHYSIFNDSKTVAIMANKTAAAREVLSRYQIMYENLPIWMQQGVKTWNKGNVDLENGSVVFTAATTASGIRGKSVNWLYIDEAAIIPNNVADDFFTSVYPTISAGETTKILLTSTPLGYNHFWKFWNEAEKGKNGFKNMFIHYSRIPGRDEKWAQEQFNLLGELKFNQEVLCEFLGSSNTLINGKALGRMSSYEPIYEKDGLQLYEEPKKDKYYVSVVDTSRGIGGDFSAFIIVDITEMPFRLVGKYKNNKISPLLYPNVIHKVAKDYNEAFVLVETNDIGQQVVDILHQELEYENIFSVVQESNKQYVSPGFGKKSSLGVRTSKAVKRQGCFGLKALIEEQKLLIFDADCISELSTFIERNGTFVADEGYNDDLAMCLVLFSWLTTNTFFKDLTSVDMRDNLYNSQMGMIASDLTPFGLIDDGQKEEVFVEAGDVWMWADEQPKWH
jgi:hypothetical protein|tara:strand:- start:508 stop:2136 length:1629 start_codon:yes stop_codon:yes gene_type:complete